MAEDSDYEIIIPENTLKSKRYLGFRRANVIEGLILAGIVTLIILKIPFVGRIKVIFIVILGLSVFFLSCVGIRDMRISEILMNIRYNLKLQKKWHLRSIKYAKKRKKFEASQSDSIYANRSAAEKIYDFAKEKINEYRTGK